MPSVSHKLPAPLAAAISLFNPTLRQTYCYFTTRRRGAGQNSHTPMNTSSATESITFSRGPFGSLENRSKNESRGLVFLFHASHQHRLSFKALPSTMYLYSNNILFNGLNEAPKILR